MTKAYISAGSNLGEREENLESARISLASGGKITKISPFFETEPVGYRAQPWFLNIALELETLLPPVELLDLCQSIEKSLGRARSFPNAPRTLDLDILFYGDLVICEQRLVVPHPRLHERRFVLEPLSRIAPDLKHPVQKKTIRTLLELCPDRSEIRELD